MNGSRPFDSEQGRREAAHWLARRDRGLSAVEQDDYLQWLAGHPAHAGFMAEQEETLGRLTALTEWRPELSSEPDPDLFAPAPKLRRYWPAMMAMAAAVVMAGLFLWSHGPRAKLPQEPSHLLAIEPKVLADGSRIEVHEGSAVDTRRYSPIRRELKLVGGEAAFTVVKDAAHPFIVEAAGLAVRAVGTVFDVRLNADSVAVLVSEGKVRVDRAAGAPLFVAAGERAVISLADPDQEPTLVRLDAAELTEDLGWRSPRFQFYETPLGEAVSEFNRCNRAQITLADARLGAMRIGGTFRADNVPGFVGMLESTIHVRATPDGANGFTLAEAP